MLEGKWEDILQQDEYLRGKHVQITVLDHENDWQQHLIPGDDQWNNFIRFIHTRPQKKWPILPPEALTREAIYADDPAL